jgi:hypothetical protein
MRQQYFVTVNRACSLNTGSNLMLTCEVCRRFPIKYCAFYLWEIALNIVLDASFDDIATNPGFAWLIRRVLDLMIEFIGPYTAAYNSLQITHCHLLPTGHSTGTILTSKWTPLYSVVLPQFWSPTLFFTTYNTSARTARKTLSSVVKNACVLVRYPGMNVLLLLTVNALGMCLPSRCLAMNICVTLCRTGKE